MLVVVHNAQKFVILGSSVNNAPGEILDKVHYHNINKFKIISINIILQ